MTVIVVYLISVLPWQCFSLPTYVMDMAEREVPISIAVLLHSLALHLRLLREIE